MLSVRVVVADIPGLKISSSVDCDGVLWVVIGSEVERPYHVYADHMEEMVGCLPDTLKFEYAPAPIPLPRMNLAS